MNIPGKGLATGMVGGLNRIHVPMTRGLGVAELGKRTFQQMGKDHLGAFAGSLTYHFVFAIVPFIAFIVSLLGLFKAQGLVQALLDQSRNAMPTQAVDLIETQLLPLTQTQETGRFGVGVAVSLAVALYGVSGAFRSIMEAMNVMYGVEEGRPFWKKYAISIGIALAVILLLLTAVVLVVYGTDISGAIANATGLDTAFEWTWNILQWPILILFVLLAFALVYYYAPDVDQSFKFITPGSLIAVLLWLVFSVGFSLYINNRDPYNATYGALAGLIVLLLYLYYSSFILLLGAEVNELVEAASPEGKDPGERVPPGEPGSDRPKPPEASNGQGGQTTRQEAGAGSRSLFSTAAFTALFLALGFVVRRRREKRLQRCT